jgi:hypothetical protein
MWDKKVWSKLERFAEKVGKFLRFCFLLGAVYWMFSSIKLAGNHEFAEATYQLLWAWIIYAWWRQWRQEELEEKHAAGTGPAP